MATFRFLVDHYVNGEIIRAGETRSISGGFSPTPDVDPLDAPAVASFYAQGPQIGGQIISRWTNEIIGPPITYWYELTPGQWALSGLGANLANYPPIRAAIGRVE